MPSPRDASPQQQVAGMQLCCSDIKFNFLLIANMQKHDSARAFRGIAIWDGKAQYVLKLSLLSSCINFIEELKNPTCHQGIVRQSESTIVLSMSFLHDLAAKVFGERVIFSKL